MTDGMPPSDGAAAAAKPTGLKAKASDVGLKVYLKSPPKAQNAMLQGFMKAQPVVAKVAPHGKKILGAGVGVLLLRKLRHRGR
ncbi:MAG: hypothetical protein JWM02_3415 [Frankiales bacterium]|nr:hypothetical protein [Frankiales bacterium]